MKQNILQTVGGQWQDALEAYKFCQADITNKDILSGFTVKHIKRINSS